MVKPEGAQLQDPSPSTAPPVKRARWALSVTPVPKSQKPPGELLTLEEKKANHIASEQKRRQAIREGFDRLTEVVPGLTRSQGRSEAIVLQKTLAFLKSELEEHRILVQRITELGGVVPPDLEQRHMNEYEQDIEDDPSDADDDHQLSPV
ncbi:uncharacterized protein V1513DRAFT_405826 [Lipomyces chichibuensis]|uniref:uncharacterized protein n=1 Tax=Lipomyces chichibuensis TaxID=1546026 RepID=UPI003344029D